MASSMQLLWNQSSIFVKLLHQLRTAMYYHPKDQERALYLSILTLSGLNMFPRVGILESRIYGESKLEVYHHSCQYSHSHSIIIDTSCTNAVKTKLSCSTQCLHAANMTRASPKLQCFLYKFGSNSEGHHFFLQPQETFINQPQGQ